MTRLWTPFAWPRGTVPLQEIESSSDAEDEDHQNLLQQVESVTKRLAELVTGGGGGGGG